MTVAREGTRQMLIEVQGLVDASPLANPRRVAVGFEANRVALLLAVLHRHAGVALHAQDVFVNVVGGVRLAETGGRPRGRRGAPVEPQRQAAGAGPRRCSASSALTGEIRPVPYGEERLREAAKHGFRRAIVPLANMPRQAMEGIASWPDARRSPDAIDALG